MRVSRRSFMKTSAALALPFPARRRVLGANSDLRIACVGIRSRGRAHIEGFRRLPGVRVVALCDVDRRVLGREVARFSKRGEQVAAHVDFRRILDDSSIDAVSFATPNHWHALQATWACEAGKDVYVEKPVSHNVSEGSRIVRAARKYGRIVQTGTQSRSNPGMRAAIEWVRSGGLGRIKLARGLCYKPRASIGKVSAPTRVPDWIDYDLWCGPAPKVPLMRRSLHYDWHWVWATGNGDLGNQGIHQMDMCRWGLGVDHLPERIFAVGGRLGYDDDGETPNTMFSVFDYDDAPLVFEVRGLPSGPPRKNKKGKLARAPMDKYHGVRIGCVFHCEGGEVRIGSYASAVAYDTSGKEVCRFMGGGNHFANFVRAVHSRRRSDLHAEIREGHLSSALCHLGNVSFLRGHTAPDDEIEAAVKGDVWASDTLARVQDHLRRNGVDTNKTPLSLGKPIRFDYEKEACIGDAAANALLTRNYREGFRFSE